MANEIVLKRSAVANNAPAVGDLALGEVGINTNDGRVFIKKNDGADSIVDITDNVRTKTTTDPSATDDNSSGHRPGDLWLNTTSQNVFILVDDSNAASIWTNITSDRGGSLLHSQWGLVHTIDNPNAFGTSQYDFFGSAVYGSSGAASAVSGDYMVIGANQEDEVGGNGSGKVYVFNIHTGLLARTIDNPNAYGTVSNDYFGRYIDIDGTKCVIAGSGEDDAGGNSSGKVYVYDVTTGELLLTINNPNPYGTSAYDEFGVSVGISGNNIIVGAHNEDESGLTNSGKAYIFNATTGALLQTLNNPNAYGTAAYDQFGNQVSIDGNNCIVGARFEDDAGGLSAGKAYIFTVSTGALLHTLDDPNAYSTSAGDQFGNNLDISGNYAVVGAWYEDDGNNYSGKVYIFNVTTGALLWTLDNPNPYGTSYYDAFGAKVAVEGNYAAVTAWFEDDAGGNQSGKVYIYDVTTGGLIHTFDNPNAYGTAAYDYFGSIVSLSDKYIITAASYEDDVSGIQSGKAYVFALEDLYETDAQSLLAAIKSIGDGSGINATYLEGKDSSEFATSDDLSLLAPLASPALTGTPTAPTQSADDNSTKLATTAYADAQALSGGDPAFTSDPLGFNYPTAPGANSIAIAIDADAKEQNCIAFGNGAQAGLVDSGTGNRNAIAIGILAKAYNRYSLALGVEAVAGLTGASVFYATAIGWNSLCEGASAISVGSLSKALAYESIAIGSSAEGRESNSIAIGPAAQSGQTNGGGDEQDTIAIGNVAKAYESGGISIGRAATTGKNGTSIDPYAIAIGYQSEAIEEKSIAIGYTADSKGTSAVSIGDGAIAKETANVAVGQYALTGQTEGGSNEGSAIAVGASSKSYEIGCVSIGALATSGRNGSTNDPYGVAVGYFAIADQGYTTALGYFAKSKGTSSVSIGANSEAKESTTIAIGASAIAGRTYASATNERAITIGVLSKAYNKGCVTLGAGAVSGDVGTNNEDYAIAIGDSANAVLANTIALGQGATVTNKGEMVTALGTNAFEKKIVLQQDFTSASFTAFTDSPVIPSNKAWKFTAQIIARQAVTGEVASYKIDGMIKNIAGTTTIVGTNYTLEEEEDATWDCVLVANDTNDTLEIQFKTDGTANAVSVLANILIMEV